MDLTRKLVCCIRDVFCYSDPSMLESYLLISCNFYVCDKYPDRPNITILIIVLSSNAETRLTCAFIITNNIFSTVCEADEL